ncbi:hypothetical protein [Vagococcus silagei]|uniref:Uncharacterized protein n=1 Tax=Vagococcus silagei TaxID=2508885 RepID=A0A4S3B2Z1_9ENTE|nr:hypothetical protein [Vagococcus silagei]THB61421.1 hypothetical protein ESZ54_05085 [Vagococcus silagei]
MTKTHFIKTFNTPLIALGTTLCTTTLFNIAKRFVVEISSSDNLMSQLPFSLIFDLSMKVAGISLFTSLIAIMIAVIVVICELADRKWNDSLDNLYPSIIETIKTRKYLYQRVLFGQNRTINQKLFNKSLKYLYVDIRNDRYILFMKYPSTDQANELLEQKIESLTKHIKTKNTNLFSFSEASYEKDGVWLIGSRKNS